MLQKATAVLRSVKPKGNTMSDKTFLPSPQLESDEDQRVAVAENGNKYFINKPKFSAAPDKRKINKGIMDYDKKPKYKSPNKMSESAIQSLMKKSEKSGISFETLREVYDRGFSDSGSEQKSFDRVNSFISGGAAANIDIDLVEKKGLWDNIWAKRRRIAAGSKEHMRKPGSKGAPTDYALKHSQVKENENDTKDKKISEAYTQAESQSKDQADPSSRFIGTDSLTDILKSQTPGQSKLSTIKRVVKEAQYHGREVPLNKPMKGDVAKSKVYVKDPKTGNVKKVNFGDKKLSIKKDQPARKSSYCARSGGQGNLSNKTSANYWSRRAWDC
jgi:hypothetical protein